MVVPTEEEGDNVYMKYNMDIETLVLKVFKSQNLILILPKFQNQDIYG